MTLGISESEANRLIAMYFKQFPLIEVYVKDAHNMAMYNQYVMNTFGQCKKEFGTMSLFKGTAVYNAALRNAQNVRVQSTASSAGLYAFTSLNRGIKELGGKSLCTVYDSVELEVPFSKAADSVEKVFYHMDDEPVKVFDWLDLPIGCDVEVGFDWFDMIKVHRGITQKEIEESLVKEFPEKYARMAA